MSHGCKIDKQDAAYCMTFTLVDWVDVFSDDKYKYLICDSLNYCVEKKGLEIFSYVIMSTHMHIIDCTKNNNLSLVVGSFKRFTSVKILTSLKKEGTEKANSMLKVFNEATQTNNRNEKFQVWKYGNYPEEVYSPKFTLSKIKYIYNNPVDASIVARPKDYYFGSAYDYAGKKGPVCVSVLALHNLF